MSYRILQDDQGSVFLVSDQLRRCWPLGHSAPNSIFEFGPPPPYAPVGPGCLGDAGGDEGEFALAIAEMADLTVSYDKYEYKIVLRPARSTLGTIGQLQQLLPQGAEGWRLAHMLRDERETIFLFERATPYRIGSAPLSRDGA